MQPGDVIAGRFEIQRVAGEGGFDGIRVTRDAIYASPVCAKEAVWRLDRQGKVIGSEFPIADRPAQHADQFQRAQHVDMP